MTFERNLLISLNEFIAVTFACTDCHVRLTFPPEKVAVENVERCPACGAKWIEGAKLSSTSRYPTALGQLIAAFADAHKSQQKDADTQAQVRVSFEFGQRDSK